MTASVNVYEAKTHLSQLLDRAAAGASVRLLLDTHALLWWLADEGLTDQARDAIADPGNLPISDRHGIAAGQLPRHHDDPFDRMLIPQAYAEGLTIATRDERFADYNVALLPT
jgi:PIN domain nuclease of toxin-antitoxin system